MPAYRRMGSRVTLRFIELEIRPTQRSKRPGPWGVAMGAKRGERRREGWMIPPLGELCTGPGEDADRGFHPPRALQRLTRRSLIAVATLSRCAGSKSTMITLLVPG